MSDLDCVIIGGGHNGLTAAAYLVRAGKRVVVLEARDIVGGFCTTEELVDTAPGFKFHPTSLDHVLLRVEPSVVTELQLSQYGLEYLEVDPFYSYVRPDGFSLCFWRDYRKTVEEIAKFSQHDARQYEYLTKSLVHFWRVGFPYLMGHPTRPSLKTIGRILKLARGNLRHLGTAARITLMSPKEAIETYFESDELRAAMAAFAASNMFPLEYPGTGIIFSIMSLQHGWGVYRARGGGGQFPQALKRYVEDRGGEVITSAVVKQLDVTNGGIGAVTLADGSTYRAKTVLGAVDPRNLFETLLPENSLPDKAYEELSKLNASSSNISTATMATALRDLPEIPVAQERANHIWRGGMLMADSFESVSQWCRDCQAGRLGQDLPGWHLLPSFLDRTLVPETGRGQTMYTYLPAVVKRWSDGSSWTDRAHDHESLVLQQLESHLPGFKEHVLGDYLVTPETLPRFSYNNAQHPFHVDMTLSRMGPWRPTPSLSGYRTPIKGLYHAGAGAHPMGTVNGWSGRTVAKMIMKNT